MSSVTHRTLPAREGDAPDVSAVLATRDRPELLRGALRAIFAQDVDASVEVIVVFDRSEPDLALLDEFADHRLVLLVNERTPGLAGARNTGTLRSRATWVGWCDDDDEWLPHRLSSQIARARGEPDGNFVVGGLLIDQDGDLIPRSHARDRVTHRELLRSRVAEAHPSTFLFRRDSVLEEVGLLDEELSGSHATDYDILLRYSALRDVLAVPEPIVRIRMHSASYFGSKWAIKIPALDRMIDKHPGFAEEPTGLAKIRGQRAFAMAAAGQRGDALRESLGVLRLNWREPRAFMAIAVSLRLVDPRRLLDAAYRRGRGI